MSLASRLTLMLAAGLLAVAAIGVTGLWLMHDAVQTYATDVQQLQRRADEVAKLRAQFQVQVQEWKNLLLRGGDAAARDKYWQAFGHSEKAVADTARNLVAGLPPGRSRELLQAFAAAHAQMGQAYRRGFDKFREGGHVAAVGDAAVKGIDREPLARLGEVFDLINREADAGAAAADRDAERALRWAAGLMALLTPGVGLTCWWVLRQAMRRLDNVVQAVDRVAGGDLSHPVAVQGHDELARLASGLRQMQQALSHLVGEVRRNAESVATASGEIAQGNLDLSGRTEQQAAALQQSAATMDQLSAAVRRNAEHARDAEGQARAASDVAQRGGDAMTEVVRTMQGIAEASHRIADIIGTIDGIAFQTNILALNAAVEAARAGEQGRGFAVVAGEVRSLAQRSAEAAREIRGLIGASTSQVDNGGALVARAGATMGEVVVAVQRVSQLIAGISLASQEQSTGVQQIGQAMAQMDQATQQNAALVEQGAAAAESLRQQSQRLVQAVSVFRVDGALAA